MENPIQLQILKNSMEIGNGMLLKDEIPEARPRNYPLADMRGA
jgi:hypothetical protein